MARDLGADQIDALQGKPGIRVMDIVFVEQNYPTFNIDNKNNPLISNPAFWGAARWLADYDDITKSLLRGQYSIHQSLLPVDFPGAPEEMSLIFSPAKAKEVLAKAGIKDPHFMLDVKNKSSFITIVQSIQASPVQGGVRVDLLPAAGSRVYPRVRAHQHQGAICMWLPDYFDVHPSASSFACNDGKSSTVAGSSGWEVPELNKETLVAIVGPDSTKCLDLCKKM